MQKESQQTINALRNMTRKDEQLDQKRFMRIKEAVEEYHIGKTKLTQLARESGALIKIDKTCLIDVAKFEKFIRTFQIPGAIRD